MIQITLKCKDYESACDIADMIATQGYFTAILCEYSYNYFVIIKEVKKK